LWFFSGISLSIGVWAILALYVFAKIRDAYDRGEPFPKGLLPLWYAMWAFHHLAVALASLAGVWPLTSSSWVAAVAAVVALASGTAAGVLGLTQCGSYARATGQDNSHLITSGIYQWSRNPQVVGWFMILLGVSIAGRSALALFLTGVFSLVLHAYTVRLEEPYLERVYGEQFRRYKAAAPRYFGVPRKVGGVP
jgi:protein-S-isoprenylcysteine O-methyltransferase Ste14